MKNEDLIKKLESARLPQAELHTHQRLLKTALLKKYESASNKTATAVKRRRIPIMSEITGFFRSDRPFWQKAMVSTFAVFVLIITAIAVTMSPLVSDYKALAIEAALNNPEIQQIIEDEDIDTNNIKLAAVFDTENGIRYFISVGEEKMVVVDLTMWTFTFKTVDIIDIEKVPVTDASKQRLADIASTDPEIEALLNKGVPIYMYYFDYIPSYMECSSFYDFAHEFGGGGPFCVQDEEVISDYWTELTARFWMSYEGNIYNVYIDMLSDTILSTSCWPIEKEDKTAIAKELVLNDPQVQALLGDAEIYEDNISVKEAAVDDIYATVVIAVSNDRIIIANVTNVNDDDKKVVILENEVIPVTDAKKQEIIDIAGIDSELRAIFDKGASVYEYGFSYVPATWLNDEKTGLKDNLGSVSPIIIKDRQLIYDELVEYGINCRIEFDGTIYIFSLDMLNRTLDWKDSVPAWFYHQIETMTTTAATK
jgi:hypothetical protein